MTTYVALLRAINVGGTGKLAMADLKKLCESCGFTDVATYIQSGNVVFRSKLATAAVQKALEAALTKKMGKPFGVLLRTAKEMAEVAADPPFPDAKPNFLLVVFFDEPLAKGALDAVTAPGPDGEEWESRGRELFIHYANGSGRSKLKLPLPKTGTSRNLNTVRKLAAMAAALK